jgi:L-alanine-DL-glutamate epimerase-like enolase superfamily enzyme
MHFAGTPVSFAAARENFLVLEHHSLDIPWWEDLVTGIPKPIFKDGFVEVPSGPGLGIELNEEVVKQHLRESEYFAPAKEWDTERSHDRLWS